MGFFDFLRKKEDNSSKDNDVEVVKVPCKKCKRLILPSTAQDTKGLCRPCAGGYARPETDHSKQRNASENRSSGPLNFEKRPNDIIRCPQCNGGLGERENLRQYFNQGFQQQYGGLFGRNSSVAVGRFTTDCPHCGKKIPLDL